MKIGLVAALNINSTNPAIGKINAPMGLMCLGAVLEPAGYEVEIIDPNFWIRDGEIKYDRDFEKEIATKLDPKKYDAIGLSTLANSYHNILRIADAIRSSNPDIPIILGGPQATHADVGTLEIFESIDVIVRGEGELVFLKALDALAGETAIESVDGITYRHADKVIRNKDAELIKDLNDLPIPAYHLYPITGKACVPLDAGRGCPYHCNFCSTCIFWKHKFRQKTPKRIVIEMELLEKAFKVPSVDFTHDLFTLDRKGVTELCRLIRAKKLKMTWSCSTRIDAVDRPLLKSMARGNCNVIYYGVESGSDDMQKVIGKNFDTKIVLEKIKDTVDSGIKAVASFIIGFPEETMDDLKKTENMIVDILGLSELVETVQLHLLAVTVSTKLWNQYKDRLRYDGLQSDQVGNLFQDVKDPLIKKHPELFPGHYYLETPDIPREFIIDNYIFGFLANTFFRWTVVLVSRRAGNAAKIIGLWHAWRRKKSFEIPEQQSALMQLLAERVVSFVKYLAQDPDGFNWKDGIFNTMFFHEATLMDQKSKLIQDTQKRSQTKHGDILETKDYEYDPQKIIDWLTGKSKAAPKKTKVKIEYIYDGWSPIGPILKSIRRKNDTVRKRRNKGGNRRRGVSSLSRGKLH